VDLWTTWVNACQSKRTCHGDSFLAMRWFMWWLDVLYFDALHSWCKKRPDWLEVSLVRLACSYH
jgi:hypothetical protein